MTSLSKQQITAKAQELGSALQRVIEEHGMSDYALHSINLEPKQNATTMGLLPDCHLKCEVDTGGRVKCEVVCE